MTLIELLVVIVIITTLVAAAIPLMAPSSSDRQLREAVRGLNTFIASAQARAVAQGRPYGVAFKRLSASNNNGTPGDPLNSNGVATEVFLVEQPAPYAGFDEGSAVQLALDNGPSGLAGHVIVRFVRRGNDVLQSADFLPPGWDPDLFPPGLIRPGDVVEVDGSRFVLDDTSPVDSTTGCYPSDAGTPDGSLKARPLNGTGQEIQVHFDDRGFKITDRAPPSGSFTPPYYTMPAAYKVLRQPVPTSEEPYQLPDDTVVDLRASGVGESEFFFWPYDSTNPTLSYAVDNNESVIVMFAPEGRVSHVIYNRAPGNSGSNEAPVVENVYFLVGPNVPAPPVPTADNTLTSAGWDAAATDEDKQTLRNPINWLRGDSRWLVIGSTTGRIATIENSFVDPTTVFGAISPFGTAGQPSETMRSYQILSARRFSRDMQQVGGR